MAPRPTGGSDNRFSILGDSPKTKKKKKHFQKVPFDFPNLPEVSPQNPKYITLSASNDEKPITEFSCFAVHRAINYISKEVISISTLRDGKLLLLVKNSDVLNNISEEEIVKELQSQHVTSIYKFNKLIDGVTKPSGVILVTFNLFTLPTKLNIS